MSLLTPPSTGRRQPMKENVGNRILKWASADSVKTFQRDLPPSAATSPTRPIAPLPRSILKKDSHYSTLPFAEVEKREDTPEPEDPLINLNYLSSPVNTILESSNKRDLVAAYSLLTARLRASVVLKDGEECDADGSWPLFQPIRKNRDAFLRCLERDLARAKQDPALTAPKDEVNEEFLDSSSHLPSPQSSPLRPNKSSPAKKKHGMSAAQVTHARDVCSLTHSALRLLTVIFSFRAVYTLFPEPAVGSLLTCLLAIPLSPTLPTPNSRKTYALAIATLTSISYLPPDLLPESVTSRVAFSLRRAIEGELGKEGKRGACSDGLRGIATLSLTYPQIFVPAFESLLPSILADLTHVTATTRVIASHCLSGYALAATRCQEADLSRRLALLVLKHMRPLVDKSGAPKECILIRNMRTAMSNTQTDGPVALSPSWALSTLAALLTLMSAAMYLPTTKGAVTKVRHALTTLSNMPSVSPKHGVSIAGTVIMGIFTHLAIQPPAFSSLDESSTVSKQEKEVILLARDGLWEIPRSHLGNLAGVSYIAALTYKPKGSRSPRPSSSSSSPSSSSQRSISQESLRALDMALGVLEDMMIRPGMERVTAVKCFQQMLLRTPAAKQQSSHASERQPYHPREALLSTSLFAGQDSGGLLSAEPLVKVAREIRRDMGQVEDITPLPLQFLQSPDVQKDLNSIWLQAVRGLSLPVRAGEGMEDVSVAQIKGLWMSLLKLGVSFSSTEHIDRSAIFVKQQTRLLVDKLLLDDQLIIVPQELPQVTSTSNSLARFVCDAYIPPAVESSLFDDVGDRNASTKLNLVREIWRMTRRAIANNRTPKATEPSAAARVLIPSAFILFEHMMRCAGMYADSSLWAEFCAEIQFELLPVDASKRSLSLFWGYKGEFEDSKWRTSILGQWSLATYSEVWVGFAKRWGEELTSNEEDDNVDGLVEGAEIVLCAPFVGEAPGLDPDSEESWAALLKLAMEHASNKRAIKPSTFLSRLAHVVDGGAQFTSRTSASVLQLLDPLLTQAGTIISQPHATQESIGPFLSLVGAGLKHSYPLNNRARYLQTLSSLSTVIDRCPKRMFKLLLEELGESIGLWVADPDNSIQQDDWEIHVPTFLWSITLTSLAAFAGDGKESWACALPMLTRAFEGTSEERKPHIQATFSAMWDDFFQGISPAKIGMDIVYELLSIPTPRLEEPELEQSIVLLRPSTPPPKPRHTRIFASPSRTPFGSINSPLRAPASPTRTPSKAVPSTPASTSPRNHKRRRVMDLHEVDKENSLQLSPLFTPVTERIAGLKGASPFKDERHPSTSSNKWYDDVLAPEGSSVAMQMVEPVVDVELSPLFTPVHRRVSKREDSPPSNKRQFLDDELVARGSPPPPLKKARTVSHASSDDEWDSIAADLIPPPLDDPTLDDVTGHNRKRKRLQPEVVVPTVEAVYNSSQLKSSGKSLDSSGPPFKIGKPLKRKAQSLDGRVANTMQSRSDKEFEELFGPQPSSSKCTDCGKSQWQPALDEVADQDLDNDDSLPMSDPPSSDDDPFIGQVTPLHLISPGIRGLQTGFHNDFDSPTRSHEPQDPDLFSEESELEDLSPVVYNRTRKHATKKTARKSVKRKAS